MAQERIINQRNPTPSGLGAIFRNMTVEELHNYTVKNPGCPVFYDYMMQHMPPERVSALLAYENERDHKFKEYKPKRKASTPHKDRPKYS